MNLIQDFLTLVPSADMQQVTIYLRRAENTVKSYCNFKDNDVLNNALNDAILELAILYYKNKGNENITQMSQGSRSVTYKSIGGNFNNSLPSEIETLCKPYRKVRCL